MVEIILSILQIEQELFAEAHRYVTMPEYKPEFFDPNSMLYKFLPLNFASILNFISHYRALVKIKECVYKDTTSGDPIIPFLLHCYY